MSGPPGAVVRECVEAYVFVPAPPRLLVQRRPPSRDRTWVPAGGKVQPTDPDLRAAVLRELPEETGSVEPANLFSLDCRVPFRVASGQP